MRVVSGDGVHISERSDEVVLLADDATVGRYRLNVPGQERADFLQRSRPNDRGYRKLSADDSDEANTSDGDTWGYSTPGFNLPCPVEAERRDRPEAEHYHRDARLQEMDCRVQEVDE